MEDIINNVIDNIFDVIKEATGVQDIMDSIKHGIASLLGNRIISAITIIIICYLALSVVGKVYMGLARIAATKKPTKNNAWHACVAVGNPFARITNHTNVWSLYKQLFHTVNRSSEVPSPLKHKLKKRLLKKGVRIQNVQVINNYIDTNQPM